MNVVEHGVLHHACFLVENVEKTARRLNGSLGIGPWGIWTLQPESCRLRGEPVEIRFRVAIAPVGNAQYELIEPLSETGLYAEQMREKGPGFHHTCIAYPSMGDLQNAREHLLKQGRPLVQEARLGEAGAFCYFALEELDSFLELLCLAALPRPEITIE